MARHTEINRSHTHTKPTWDKNGQRSGSQPGLTLPSTGHSAMLEAFLMVTTGPGVGECYLYLKGRDAAQHPPVLCRTALTTESYLAQNVNSSVESEKPWARGSQLQQPNPPQRAPLRTRTKLSSSLTDCCASARASRNLPSIIKVAARFP